MTVYVDDMYKYPMGQFRRMKMSHMIADTEDELHAMATKIGVARKWYQGDHYDICMSMREKAVQLGAKEVTMRELSGISHSNTVAWRHKTYGMNEPKNMGKRHEPRSV